MSFRPFTRDLRPKALTDAEGALPRARIDSVLETLPPKQRIAFCMYRLDGKEQQEIGDILGFSKSYVCKLIKRAEEKIRAEGWEVGDE